MERIGVGMLSEDRRRSLKALQDFCHTQACGGFHELISIRGMLSKPEFAALLKKIEVDVSEIFKQVSPRTVEIHVDLAKYFAMVRLQRYCNAVHIYLDVVF